MSVIKTCPTHIPFVNEVKYIHQVCVTFPLLPGIFRLPLNTFKATFIQLINGKKNSVNGKKRTVFTYFRSDVLRQTTMCGCLMVESRAMLCVTSQWEITWHSWKHSDLDLGRPFGEKLRSRRDFMNQGRH